VDVGEIDGEILLFVGVEYPGLILVYKLVDSNVSNPVFQSGHYAGGVGKSWANLYYARETRDVYPECIRFVKTMTNTYKRNRKCYCSNSGIKITQKELPFTISFWFKTRSAEM